MVEGNASIDVVVGISIHWYGGGCAFILQYIM